MDTPDLVLRGRNVVTPGDLRPATVHVTDGVISKISAPTDVPKGVPLVDLGGLILMPGLVDAGARMCEPGRAEWEGFGAATRAAAAGGVTTVADLPTPSSPPTTSLAALEAKLRLARGRIHVDVGFWGGLVPGNGDQMAPLHAAGVLGFYCTLAPLGIPDFPAVEEFDLRGAMPTLTRLGALLAVHAEDGRLLADIASSAPAPEDRQSYVAFAESRPAEVEVEAVELILRLVRELRTRVHFRSLSTDRALEALRGAREEWLPVTAETAPHYLTFAANAVPAGTTALKCYPPVREQASREHLWRALAKELVEQIASDHAPCPPELKALESGDLFAAQPGVSSLQLLLPATWTEARQRGYGFTHLARWLCEAPACLLGIQQRKGSIAVGRDADFVVFDAEKGFRVEPGELQHTHPVSPWGGRLLRGVVRQTFVRGIRVWEDGEPTCGPIGEIVRAPRPGPIR